MFVVLYTDIVFTLSCMILATCAVNNCAVIDHGKV